MEYGNNNKITARIKSLRQKTLSAKRYLSLEQASIITSIYKENEGISVPLKRALSLAASLDSIAISIDPEELIAGNRTAGIRSGVVFPEAGISWLEKEIDTLPERSQDPFNVNKADIEIFRDGILPFWKGRTLEDDIYSQIGDMIDESGMVVKINQRDHAQGHICPDAETWLRLGPDGLKKQAQKLLQNTTDEKKDFYKGVIITLEAASRFMLRYARLAGEMADNENDTGKRKNLTTISDICSKLASDAPESFREALQSVWFLFVILQMESNASSFSPGRMDQYLLPFYRNDKAETVTDAVSPIELIDALFIKFNQIVYMRNSHSARYFAGFPIGFNITIGGTGTNGADATNELSWLFLKAQEHIRLPQPNLTARLHKATPKEFIDECSRIIGLGTGMPQIVNDESIIPSLCKAGIEKDDATDYVLVGCVELSTSGNYLGWSDAAMFNLVKVLELALNDGICMISGRQTGLRAGCLTDFRSFDDLKVAFRKQIDYFTDKMIFQCEIVERCHQKHLPSPFLSSVIEPCLQAGTDVTAGGAKYNFSGIQAIQPANIADSLASLKKLVFDDNIVSRSAMLDALRSNFEEREALRQICINHVPKYGNDIQWVDELGAEWIEYFAGSLKPYRNYRGGAYQMGLYTVSAHVPMGQNVGATPEGRMACSPLADGGLSPMYGRDRKGPTAVLNSVARIPSHLAGNGTLLNMKFSPSAFRTDGDISKFSSLLSAFTHLPVHHVQFNVVTSEELIKARTDPESYRGLIVRVAGYSAFFTELAPDLQDEIIARTTQGDLV